MSHSIYTVRGVNWTKQVEIEDDIFDTYQGACIEAATRLLENPSLFAPNEDLTGFITVEKNGNDLLIIPTYIVLINASKYDAARLFE